MKIEFPRDFLWGAATSSYQIEGGHTDGRGESIWDRFCQGPGNVRDGSDGSIACDHYHRFADDVALMRELGLRAYRFSVAWPRVVPEGRGAHNERGLDFYERLVDALLKADIEPWVTLYHWDLPQALEAEGGWTDRATAEAFRDYADVVTRRLGDRVRHWITHNEPWCASVLGYAHGIHAPGHKDWSRALAASHHLLLSHGLAMPVIRANVAHAVAGITLNLQPAQPASPSEADADACRYHDGVCNRWFLDPLFGRGYPQDVIEDHLRAGRIDSPAPAWLQPGDLESIAVPNDFLGVNYYTREITRSRKLEEADNAPRTLSPGPERTSIGWEVHPDSLRAVLVRLHEEYQPPPMYITENGAAYATRPDASGRVRDEERRRYLESHLTAAHAALDAGVDLRGYFVWSLLDNFEWAEGYEQRFGVVFVDYETQQRTPKDSALWYRDAIRAGGFRPGVPTAPQGAE